MAARGARTVLVRGLPGAATAAHLESLFGHLGPLRRCFVVTEKGSQTCRGFGFVTFSLAEDAQRALETVPSLGGHRLGVTPARQRPRGGHKTPQKGEEGAEQEAAGVPDVPPVPPPRLKKPKGASKKARLIVRNLSFKCSEDDLHSLFSPFGTVLEVNIPRKPGGQPRGFAFVQLGTVPEAARALRGLNMSQIHGRPVAVDWAVAKDKYQAMKGSTEGGSGEVRGGDGGEEEEEEKEEEEEEEEEEKEEEEEEEEEEKEEEEKEEEEKEEEEEEEEEDEEEGGAAPQKRGGRGGLHPPPSDVGEGRTVFIRNLPFDVDEEELGGLLQRFGALRYVRLVLHPQTELPRGSAFAQFRTKEAAEECVRAAQGGSEGGALRLGGRVLRADPALSREEAGKRPRSRGNGPRGTRNLWLAREGLIRAGTKAAEGVSDSDMAKRARFEELKRQKLQDPNIFVSPTRLCLHNLPKALDSARLRGLLRGLLRGGRGGPPPNIKECRVMRAQGGQGPSLGFAFVAFGEHQEALAALRCLNNNPQLFGPSKRPIVEFSLEDRRKLKLKEQRAQRSLLKLKPKPKDPGATESTGPPQKGKITSPSEGAGGAGGGQDPPPVPWSGFRTDPGGQERVELPGGGSRKRVLALPSHRGPKIRKRDKGKVKPPPPKQPKAKRQKEKHKVPPPKTGTPPKQARRRRGGPGGSEARFEELVERYKRKILGSDPPKRSKWFES